MEKNVNAVRLSIRENKTTFILLSPKLARENPDQLHLPMSELLMLDQGAYTPEMYARHMEHLMLLEQKYGTFTVITKNEITDNILLYAKNNIGALVCTTKTPNIAFSTDEHNMSNAFWEFLGAVK